jgi:hypothetical protein
MTELYIKESRKQNAESRIECGRVNVECERKKQPRSGEILVAHGVSCGKKTITNT